MVNVHKVFEAWEIAEVVQLFKIESHKKFVALSVYEQLSTEFDKTHEALVMQNQNMVKASANYDRLCKKIETLFEALDLATDLLPVPERCQDDEWREKEARVNEIYKEFADEIAEVKNGKRTQ